MRSIMVKIHEDFVQNQKLPNNVGLVIRGPYEKTIQVTKNFHSCEMMYDLLIDGTIHEMVPTVYCSKIRR